MDSILLVHVRNIVLIHRYSGPDNPCSENSIRVERLRCLGNQAAGAHRQFADPFTTAPTSVAAMPVPRNDRFWVLFVSPYLSSLIYVPTLILKRDASPSSSSSPYSDVPPRPIRRYILPDRPLAGSPSDLLPTAEIRIRLSGHPVSPSLPPLRFEPFEL